MILQSEYTCQSCRSRNMSLFYEVSNVPVHSCLLFSTKQEALAYPRRNIQLGFCEDCGFISNVIFDPTVHEYSPKYEDQQCFSPTFNSFAEQLARRLIERYDLHGKNILEIGCGKGDFLTVLCELGDNRGIGIDPSSDKSRLKDHTGEKITFIQEFYCEEHAKYQADFICCRHTLEHIQPTFEFMSLVRRSLRDKQDTIVFFELPEVHRVLKELAFWDIYYEHCSYFSLGSLAHLFNSCGFEILNLDIDYDDQYLLIEARPGNGSLGENTLKAGDLDKLRQSVRHFARESGSKLDWWKHHINESKAKNRKIAIWGSGSKCVAFLTTLQVQDAIDHVVDINPHRHGKFIPGAGKEIIGPESLKDVNPDSVIVMNPVYVNEIIQMLVEMNLQADVISV